MIQAHVELLRMFLAHRDDIVERIQTLLNAQRKPVQYLQDVSLLSRHFEDCFFTLAALTSDQSRLKTQLEQAHWESGFKPRHSPGLHNDLIDPAEMMVRAFHLWQQTRWPGHSGRLRYAQTLFNLYVLRRLTLLTMRLWDAGPAGDGDEFADRLSQIQRMLDQLWKSTPADHPVLVRDARWLIPVAQSPTTDELSGYFHVAERIAAITAEEHRLEIHKAGVQMAGGHLRSQLRHLSVQKSVPIGEHSLVLTTRTSNALDLALLIEGLAALLEAYERAIQDGDSRKKLELAAAICQGISPDPELFVNRLDLLGPYSMIEYLFITTGPDGRAGYILAGQRHVQLVRDYQARITRLAMPLQEDCRHFRPIAGAYSPYGVLYGFSSNLLEHMAFKTLQPEAVSRFSLEDVFSDGGVDKLAWVSGWRKLPHIKPEMAKLFEYPQQFAEEIFARIEQALGRRVSEAEANAPQTGRLFIVAGDDPQANAALSQVPDLPAQYIRASAHASDEKKLLHSRFEGEFLLSYKTSSGWVAVSKDLLTEVLGAGRDAKIAGLPREAAEVLKLMCPNLVFPT